MLQSSKYLIILLVLICAFSIYNVITYTSKSQYKSIHLSKKGIQIFHISFVLFWITLLIMGFKKSIWLFGNSTETFSKFQESQHSLNLAFVLFGLGIISGLGTIIINLIITFQQKQIKNF